MPLLPHCLPRRAQLLQMLLLLLLLLTIGASTPASAPIAYQDSSQYEHRQLQAATSEDQIALTVDYDRSHGYDTGGPAPICWKTFKGIQSRLAACPPEIIMKYYDPPPNPLYSMRNYTSHFRFTAKRDALGLVGLADKTTEIVSDIWHANVHSCVATVGFCIPSIKDTPGLSTHSPAKKFNFTPMVTQPGWVTVVVPVIVRLDPGSYTIISHVLFDGREGVNNTVVKWSVAQAVTREVLPPKIMLTIAPTITYAMGAMVALTALFLLVNWAALIYYQKHKIMKFSQGNILQAMTFAGLVAVGSLPLAAVSSTPSCLLRPWLQIIPLNILFGLLFGKTWRIHRLLNNKQLKAIKVKESAVFFVASLLTLPEIAIHGLYFLLAPPSLSEKNVLNEFTFVDICASDPSYKRVFDGLHLGYGAFILILGCYVAQKSAALTTLFNEGVYILFAIYTCSMLAVIIVPATFAVAASPQTAYILRVLGVCLAVIGTVGAINLPKIWLISSGVEMSLLEDGKTTQGGKTTSGSIKTGGNSGSVKTGSSARAPPAGGGNEGAKEGGSSISVKNHIPSAVFPKLQEGLAAIKQLKDKQQQGYAFLPAEWDACVEQVKSLLELLDKCVFVGGAAAAGAAGEAGKAKEKESAKVAPSS